jgi:hypothetical protein
LNSCRWSANVSRCEVLGKNRQRFCVLFVRFSPVSRVPRVRTHRAKSSAVQPISASRATRSGMLFTDGDCKSRQLRDDVAQLQRVYVRALVVRLRLLDGTYTRCECGAACPTNGSLDTIRGRDAVGEINFIQINDRAHAPRVCRESRVCSNQSPQRRGPRVLYTCNTHVVCIFIHTFRAQ